MIPGAFGSEITKNPPINEVLRRYNHFTAGPRGDFTTILPNLIFGTHSQIYARQGIALYRSTLADWVGRAAFALRPVHARLLEQLKQSKSAGELTWTYYDRPLLDDLLKLKDIIARKYRRRRAAPVCGTAD